MASTYSPESRSQLSGTQVLDHPAGPEDPARHRVPRQSRATAPVLGVTAMAAALGATGLAATAASAAPAPAVTSPDRLATTVTTTSTTADPGLALAARIQQQADTRRTAAEEAARLDAAREAAAKRAAQAEAAAAAPVQVVTPVQVQAPAQVRPAAAVEVTAVLPVARYTLGAQYGQSGSHWAQLHTGLDFAAPTGTPVVAVAGGTVASAGWSGAYGYRVIQTLPDGTELWYCHLSSIAVTAGQVAPGTVLGKVGATGTVTGITGPHLHLEVRPAGAAAVDPAAWLRGHGLTP